MTDLYTADEAAKMKARAKRGKWTALGILALSTAACAALCFLVRTGSAHALFIAVLALSILGGWAAILIYALAASPAKVQAAHMENVLKGPAEEFSGMLRIGTETLQIPKSIAIRKACLDGGEEPVTLNVNARYASRLPPDGSRVWVRAAHRYIFAYEVQDEKAL
ncbi:MAG: hypothetical protein IKQ41_02685 [Clostridia bacterium]|nr:hypothetical protein [Clostridia bacterium]